MNTHKLCGFFALLISMVLVLGIGVNGTVAYIATATPAITNTFAYDPSDFPPTPPAPTPTPVPTPEPIPEIDLPDTGDHSSLALWSALLTVSAAGILVLRGKHA